MFLRYLSRLVDGAVHFIAAERRNDAFDLPPVAEMRDIAVIAAALGTRRCLEAGVVTIAFDQVRCIGEGKATVDKRAVHAMDLTRRPLSD
jgi:hypothetical protein